MGLSKQKETPICVNYPFIGTVMVVYIGWKGSFTLILLSQSSFRLFFSLSRSHLVLYLTVIFAESFQLAHCLLSLT